METYTITFTFERPDITVADFVLDLSAIEDERKERGDVIRDREKERNSEWFNTNHAGSFCWSGGNTGRAKALPGGRRRDIDFAIDQHNGVSCVEE